MTARGDRVERLTNLLALLLETREPVSLVQIAGQLDGQYPEGQMARRAAFERDKAALREIGVPIEQEIIGGGEYAGQTRYWIDRERYELRDLRLDDDEARALQVAMAATRPGSASGQEALWKLGAGRLDGVAPIAAVLPDLPSLPVLRDAVATRTSVRFTYRQLERTVDPWGLLLRDGFWYLVGHDHVRGERRTYRIDRIDGIVATVAGSSFERPAGFDPRSALPTDPKAIGATDDVPDARVLIGPGRATAVLADLGDQRLVTRRRDGSVEVAVACANLPAFRSWLLGLGEHAEVLAPPEVRSHIVEWLEAVVG
jgi:predicted DNA-binding transcriptional regulator YafY